MNKDYKYYEFTGKERLRYILEAEAIVFMLAILFYDSLLFMLPGVLLVPVYLKEKKRTLIRKRHRGMQMEFRELLGAFTSALQTGRSIENAFCEAVKDTEEFYGNTTELLAEMKQMAAAVKMNEKLELLLADFARRSHMEELEYFSEVFLIAKRSGGNLPAIMRHTSKMLEDRISSEEEIYTVISEKRFEFYIMAAMPFGMLAYLRIGASGLVERLYGNLLGILVMTACMVVYFGCYLYGRRLLEIEW